MGEVVGKTSRGYSGRFHALARVVSEIADKAEMEPHGNSVGELSYVSIRHPPCPKYRVVFFLETPWRVGSYARRKEAERAYKGGLKALAAGLEVEADIGAMDLARLFFDPRHPEDIEPEAWFVEGNLLAKWPAEAGYESGATAEDHLNLEFGPRRSQIGMDVLASAVMAIRNDGRFSDRNEWVRVLAAIHEATEGSPEGLALADQWSSTWTEGLHDPAATRHVWKSLREAAEAGDVTGATVIWLAQRDGWSLDPKRDDLAPHGDVWNGKRFAGEFRDKLIHVAAADQWLEYNRFDG